MKFLFFLFFLSVSLLTHAQRVGINHQNPTESLDIDGTMRVRKLPLPEEATISTNKDGSLANTPNVVFKPQYAVVADANGVLGRRNMAPDFFYMPPMVFPTREEDAKGHVSFSAGTFTVNLYDEYVEQFVTNAAAVSSTSTALHQWAANELEYHITYYDSEVFTNLTLNEAGVLTYRVRDGVTPTKRSFFNIVFKVKA